MLGTFSFELLFKSYPCFTFRSLEILEISKRPFSPSSSPSALSRRRVQCSAARRRRGEPARPLLLRAGAHTSRGSSSTAFGFALEPPRPCHAPPPSAEPPARPPPRRRRGEPVAAPQGLISRAHEHYFYPASYSSPPFAFSVLPHLRTPPPPRLTSDELTPTIDPPPQTRSTHANPTIRSASS